MKILVNTPSMHPIDGGVANHYDCLKPYWHENVIYNEIGRRKGKRGTGPIYLPWDIFKFILKIVFWRPNLVLLNPSFYPRLMFQCKVFYKLSQWFHVPVAIMIHGWDDAYAATLDHRIFVETYNRSAFIAVMARRFKDELLSWGMKCPIVLAPARVDDKLLADFDISQRKGECNRLLVMSRLDPGKGILESIETFAILKKQFPKLELRIVGKGELMKPAKQLVNDLGIEDVSFSGFIPNEQKPEEFKKADFYLFPTTHTEGMPASLLEALAFGLPVLTRPMGGIVDIFDAKTMGILTDDTKPEEYAKLISELIRNKQRMQEISLNNYEYASKKYLASAVACQMENYFRKYTSNN